MAPGEGQRQYRSMNPHNSHPDDEPLPSGRPDGAPDGPAAPEPGPGPGPEAFPPAPPPLYPDAQPPYVEQPQNFFSWIRSQGIHRGTDRWIGGVASGIAHRLGVDPLIVRGIFIVLTIFAGVGVLLYGVAWALLPEPDGRIHVQEAAAGRWSAGMTGALIATILGFPNLGSGFWGWERNGFAGFVWTVFWIAGAIYLVYYLSQRTKRRNGTHGTAPFGVVPRNGVPSNGVPSSGAPYGSAPSSTLPSDVGAHGDNSGPPYTSGFGGGRYETAGPASAVPARVRNVGPGTPAVAVTTGLALLVGGGIKALETLGVISLGDSTNAVAWAGGAAVLGLGILAAGLRGRTSGILGFFAVVALIVGGIFNVVPTGDRIRFQNANWNPASIEQATAGFDITGGSGTADLTQLNLTPPLTTDVVVPLDVTASNLTVVIPDTVPVEIRADMTLGNLNEGTRNHGGMTSQRSNYNIDKPGATLIVKIDGTMSNVTIQGGH